MQDVDIEICLRSATRESRGRAALHALSKREAVRKGVTGMLACWGVALLTLPIPLVHFIAPPVLLLIGPLVGFGLYKLHSGGVDLVGGEAPCPDCRASVALRRGPERWPLDLSCPGCGARLKATRLA